MTFNMPERIPALRKIHQEPFESEHPEEEFSKLVGISIDRLKELEGGAEPSSDEIKKITEAERIFEIITSDG